MSSTVTMPTFWVSTLLLTSSMIINQAGYLSDVRSKLYNIYWRITQSKKRSRRDDPDVADREIKRDVQNMHQSLMGNIGGIAVGWTAITWDYLIGLKDTKMTLTTPSSHSSSSSSPLTSNTSSTEILDCSSVALQACTAACPPTPYSFAMRSVSYILLLLFTSLAFYISIWLWSRRILAYQAILYQKAAISGGDAERFARQHTRVTRAWVNKLGNRYRVLGKWRKYWRDRWRGMLFAGIYIMGVTLAESQEVTCKLARSIVV